MTTTSPKSEKRLISDDNSEFNYIPGKSRWPNKELISAMRNVALGRCKRCTEAGD